MIGRAFGSLAVVIACFAAEALAFEKIAFIDGWDYGHIFETETRPSFGQIAAYAKVPQAEAVRRLLEIAARCGAADIVMECVDYGNYPEDVCEVIREFETAGSHK